jgi:TrmH family RNA methyltransferase
VTVLTSKDNPKVKRWIRLASDARFRRSEKRALIEGPHLLSAALQYGIKLVAVLATEDAAVDAVLGDKPVILGKGVFRAIVEADTPQGVAAEIVIPAGRKADGAAVFLEGIQDPANVGAILRSAAAFGIARVVLDQACADPWSPRALRAGMGGHFALDIVETKDLGAELDAFRGTVAAAVPRGGAAPGPADAWVFGAEGRGLSEETLRRAKVKVTIPMAAGTESLNVAAAAAICLYQSFSRSAGLS